MKALIIRRVLLQEGSHYHRPDPCAHNSLHELRTATAQNVSMACQHAYAYMHRRGGSPIPYLLAGLAAMLALIAISLFILACSYWKLVGCVEQHAAAAGRGGAGVGTSSIPPVPAATSTLSNQQYSTNPMFMAAPIHDSTKLVVIMAGHDKPTFIAQPVGLVLQETSVASSNSTSAKL